ncbi:MAG: hypothetical protein ABFC30_03995, partial [Proteiniphilum sp.]
LSDIRGEKLSQVGCSPLHEVDITPQYREQYPFAVVDSTPHRNWIWELVLDREENPIIAMVGIDESKTSHNYYHVSWIVSAERRKVFPQPSAPAYRCL